MTGADKLLIARLDAGFGWTAERLAKVRLDQRHRLTPCTELDLGTLVEHLLQAVTRFATAIGAGSTAEGHTPGEDNGEAAGRLEALRASTMDCWRRPDAFATTYRIALGDLPGPTVAQILLTELVVHGWDIARATGDQTDIPVTLAEPLLAFVTALVTPDTRRAAFGPPVASPSPSASDRLVAYLGRDPDSWGADAIWVGRTIDAPGVLVRAALTEPTEIVRWWANNAVTDETGELMRVRFDNGEQISWRQMTSHPKGDDDGVTIMWSFQETPHPLWTGSAVTWSLCPAGETGTRVRSCHRYLNIGAPGYSAAETLQGWEYFMSSLAQHLELGAGQPYRDAPRHG